MAHRTVGGLLADPGVGQVAQRRIGVGAGDAIGGQTQVQLEATERLFGVSTEDGIAGAVEEPERAQRLLQLKHVVPMEVGHAQIQRAVAQVVGGVHQGRPHLLGHLFARRERRGGEELGQSGGGSVIENAGDGVLGKMPDAGQARLHVLDGGAGVVSLDRFHVTSTCSRTSRPWIRASRGTARGATPRPAAPWHSASDPRQRCGRNRWTPSPP